jgi:glycosyltransferase involved in cell wall biosynthesis
MRRRRVLIVSHVFPPLVAGGAPRMGQFARLLPEFGWDVTVVTARHEGVDAGALAALDGRATIVETWSPASAVVKRGAPTPKRGARSWARRTLRTAAMSVLFPDREIFWVPGAIAAGKRLLAATPHDVVFATHGPASNLVVGRTLASGAKLPLVVDFRDLWSSLPIQTAFASPLHRAAARRLEGAIVRAASRVVAVAPNMATELAATHGVPCERAVSITNGFDPDDVARVRDVRAGGERPFRLMYLGTVNANYNLDPFWRAVKQLAEAHRIAPETLRVEFVGNLAMSDVRALGIDAFVETKPFVAHAKVFDELARADALLMVETPGYYARYSYAAKVFDYLLTGKPVLALVEAGGNTARLLADAGVGHIADPTDAGAIAGALQTLLSLRGAVPRVVRSQDAPFAAFDRRNLVRTLAAMLDDVASNEPHGSWS